MPEREKLKQNQFKDKVGARIEEFIISNSNGNGINPNPTESGNSPDWDTGIKENDDYQADALDESGNEQ